MHLKDGTLKDRIGEDMKAAMRARAADRLSAIRMLLAAIRQKEIDERITVDDAQVVAIVDRLIRQRRDSVEQFEKAARQDLADREKFEIDVLSAYLPQQASADEVAAEIDAAIASVGAAGPQAMGKVMGVLKQRLAGRTDLAAVSAQVKARLAGA
ncbi:MAG: GatB/YqeY domain-containing protein [Burkholderiales bacterium]|nr:MAG: GatB/YqeY domain-containing protein [Burkholderiales bacterium]